jgi:hypothetical protein
MKNFIVNTSINERLSKLWPFSTDHMLSFILKELGIYYIQRSHSSIFTLEFEKQQSQDHSDLMFLKSKRWNSHVKDALPILERKFSHHWGQEVGAERILYRFCWDNSYLLASPHNLFSSSFFWQHTILCLIQYVSVQSFGFSFPYEASLPCTICIK